MYKVVQLSKLAVKLRLLLPWFNSRAVFKTLDKWKDVSPDTVEKQYQYCFHSLPHIPEESKITFSKYENGTLKFYPPVYTQRYEAVSFVLKEDKWKGKVNKVVDFGCAELKYFQYLKYMPGLQEFVAVDIDIDLLERNAGRTAPLISDSLSSKRTCPLHVLVYAGSVADYDSSLQNTDAVVAIELLEHLYPNDLKQVPKNIFGNVQPKLAVFTTPNADFNQLFPNMTGFRHLDHKFEWTRQQFQMWTQNVIDKYPNYKVDLYGIGPGPSGTEHLGCCSQMAVFERLGEKEYQPEPCTHYKLVREYTFPFYVDTRTNEEKIIYEIQYWLLKLPHYQPDTYDYQRRGYKVPLQTVQNWAKEWCSSPRVLREVLTNKGMCIIEEGSSSFLVYREDSLYESDDEPGLLPPSDSLSDEEPQPHLAQVNLCCAPVGDEWADKGARPKHCSSAPVGDEWADKGARPKHCSSAAQHKQMPSARPHSSYVRKSPKTISKSFSLDSCLENINCEPVEVQAFYLNMLSECSNSALLDSGYPFSFSQHDADLTPEQVDELGTSDDSLSQDEEADEARLQDGAGRDVFLGEAVVENGDVANNNRDGEGNNVEGVAALARLLAPQPDANDNNVVVMFDNEADFPPWLLNMGELAQGHLGVLPPPPPLVPDEGLGSESSSDCELEEQMCSPCRLHVT